MAEKEQKVPENFDSIDVTELDDEALEDVAGGLKDIDTDEPNTNCNNTQCCGG